MEPDEDWFDPDIAAMKLGYGEKAGLQIYRNYTRSFEEHAVKKFVEALDLDLADLIAKEDVRFLPVIVCACRSCGGSARGLIRPTEVSPLEDDPAERRGVIRYNVAVRDLALPLER